MSPGGMPPLALLSGGLATRLRPLAQTIPKAMMEVAGEPFIAHQLRLLHRRHIERVVICIGYLGDAVRKFVGNGAAFGLSVAYSEDGPTLLGTGGAIKKALPLLDDIFFVMYGDSYFDIPFEPVVECCRASGKLALMAVHRNENRWDKSNVAFDGLVIRRYDKRAPTPDMAFIDYGLGILSASPFRSHAPGGAFDLADLYTDLAKRGELAGYEVTERFYEIGSHSGLKETDEMLTQERRRAEHRTR